MDRYMLQNFVKQLRQNEGIGMQDFAKRHNISIGVLHAVEHNCDVKISTIEKILKTYNMKIEYKLKMIKGD